MAGTIIADYIRTDANKLSLNVGNTTFATINAMGLLSSTGTQLIAANGVISADAIQTGNLNANLMTTGTVPKARMPSGAVLQVVQAAKTDAAVLSSLTAQWSAVSNLAVSITPTSATSKILVILHVAINGQGGASTSRGRITRNSTAIAQGDAAGSRPRGVSQVYHYVPGSSEGGFTMGMISTTFLDSPATTSPLTYQFEVGGDNNGTVYINRTANDRNDTYNDTRSISTITVMEIAG